MHHDHRPGRPRSYILEGHTPVPCDDHDLVMEWLDDTSRRRIAYDELPGAITVSTVFLCFDTALRYGPPMLFESVVYGKGGGQEHFTYASWDEAAAGHANIVATIPHLQHIMGLLPELLGHDN